MALKFDEIGYWSELKLEILEKYASAYSQILTSQKWAHHLYIDAFAGAGKHISKTTNAYVRGSPQIALDIQPPFKEYYFIDIDGEKVGELQRLASGYPHHQNIYILQGNCNEALLKQVFPKMNKSNIRCLCLLDPYGVNLDWEVIRTAGQLHNTEIFLNFPVMDMNRNMFLTDSTKIDPSNSARMDKFWGDHSWSEVVYFQQQDMFGDIHEKKQHIRSITEGFRDRLINVAGFEYVSLPIPMRNRKRGLLYFLFFASNNKTGNKILSEILSKYRNKGIS